MIRAKMSTAAVVILAVVIVASVSGILWSRQRTRMYQEQRERAEELKHLRERTDELEKRMQEDQRQRPPRDGGAD